MNTETRYTLRQKSTGYLWAGERFLPCDSLGHFIAIANQSYWSRDVLAGSKDGRILERILDGMPDPGEVEIVALTLSYNVEVVEL